MKDNTPVKTASFEYVDKTGDAFVVMGRIERWEPALDGKSAKSFLPYVTDENGIFLARSGTFGKKFPLYHLDEVVRAVCEGKPVFLCEGEGKTDALRMRIKGHAAVTTIPFGAQAKLEEHHLFYLHGAKQIIVLSDSDDAGRSSANERAATLAANDETTDVRNVDFFLDRDDGSDIADWLQEGHKLTEFRELVDAASHVTVEHKKEQGVCTSTDVVPKRIARMRLVRAADVKITRTEWLEIGYIPAQKFTLLEGLGDRGKTALVMTLLAKHSIQERLFPVDALDAAHYPLKRRANILIIAKEDDHGTLKARLREADADMERITFIDGLDYINEQGQVEDHDGVVCFPRDLEALKAAIQEVQADIIYIDALHSHVIPEKPNDPVSVRQAYQRIIDLCECTGVTIIAVRHWGKGTGHSHDRGLGSSEIGHIARSVVTFAEHPKDETLYVAAQTKKNLWKKMPAVVYRIESTDSDDDDGNFFTVPKIVIVGTDATINANDLAMSAPEDGNQRTQVERCILVILDLFEDADTITAADIAEVCDFSKATVDRARSKLTDKNVLKRGRTGKVGEKGASVTYTIDRDAAALLRKKLRSFAHMQDAKQREGMRNNGSEVSGEESSEDQSHDDSGRTEYEL